eukprot:COSAG01_NODE_1906_length_8932_cov_6.105263_7_plen_1049_part_00
MRLLVAPSPTWTGPEREVEVEARDLASLLLSVASALGVAEVSSLESFDEDFEEWVAVVAMDTLAGGARVQPTVVLAAPAPAPAPERRGGVRFAGHTKKAASESSPTPAAFARRKRKDTGAFGAVHGGSAHGSVAPPATGEAHTPRHGCADMDVGGVATWALGLSAFDGAARTALSAALREEEVDGPTLLAYGKSLADFELLRQILKLKAGKAAKLFSAVQALIGGEVAPIAEGIPRPQPRGAAQSPAAARPKPSGTSALASELAGLKLGSLSQRAKAAGVDEHAVLDALDADDAKAALIALILARSTAPAPDPLEELRAELSELRLGALSKRAREAGASEEQVMAAQDTDEPKESLIALILELAAPADPLVALRAELAELKLGELSQRAKAAGVDEHAVLDALDADDAKAALIALILARSAAPAPDPLEELRAELSELRLGALSKRAREAGASEEQVMAAQDTDEPKESLIALILVASSTKLGNRKSRPHFKPGGDSPVEVDDDDEDDGMDSVLAAMLGPHVMLSYQWDIQDAVVKVRQVLTQKKIKTWMDIDGGMEVDLYDSMARGVSNAACVVCFMTQQYEDSANCKMELKFAKDKNVPIIPVMYQGGGWRAGGWLGLITSGALWVAMNDTTSFDESVEMLTLQIEKASGGALGLSDTPASEAVLSAPATPVVATESPAGSLPELALLPADCPHLSENTRVVTEMYTLKELLLTGGGEAKSLEVSSQKRSSKVGAYGMGGVGKTIMAAWIARDLDIRKHFDLILWITCSQTPNIPKLLALAYLQATGSEVGQGKAAGEIKEMVKNAIQGQRVLLILDDVWDAAQETALNCVDVTDSTASRLLVTTRIKGLLPEKSAEHVSIGLPSKEEALQLLCCSAGVALSSTQAPPRQAAEVVELCGRLPLALDIAGRLVTDMGLGVEDWAGVPAMLKEEMAAVSGEETSLEYRIISTSMNAIPARDLQGCCDIFAVLATVAEDTYVPPRAFQIMLSAISARDGMVPALQLRKWMQMLINRSLVLNNWGERYVRVHTTAEKAPRDIVPSFDVRA